MTRNNIPPGKEQGLKFPLIDRLRKRADLLAWLAVGLFTLLIGILLLQSLGELSLWMDEGFYHLTAQTILEHGTPLFPSGHMYYKAIVYAYVLALFSLILGLNAFTLRLVSVLSTLALMPLLYLMGKRYFNRLVALSAVGVFALSIWVAEYSRVALYFAPLQLVCLLGVYFFYRGFFEDIKRYRPLAAAAFMTAPLIHQLGMSIWFCFPALFILRGWKRFFKKDVLVNLSLVTVFYGMIQLHEYFFWKVGYVYDKTDMSLQGMLNYFFTGFSTGYFREVFRSFPNMSLVVLAGFFFCLGLYTIRPRTPNADDWETRWLYLSFCLLFPLVFLGFFRTHIQPRYIYQLYPVFVLLYLVGLHRIAQAAAALILGIFSRIRPRMKTLVGAGIFLLVLVATVDGVGWGRLMDVIHRQYRDPVTTDIITRSGRTEHYDHKGPGEFVRHHLRDDDLVVAIHVVFQYIYVGRVDYWLWSGGPGTWDAWEKTEDGWRDFYIGARWINNLKDLKKLLDDNRDRRIWLVASPSLLRTDHIKTEIASFIRKDPRNLVFRGKDGMSEVYLWNADESRLTGSLPHLEGEWQPLPGGLVDYDAAASRGAALYLKTGKAKRRVQRMDTLYPPGRYRVSLRVKSGRIDPEDRILGLEVFPRGGRRPAGNLLIRGGGFDAPDQYQDFSFDIYLSRETELTFHWLIPGKSDVWIDYLDIRPEREEQREDGAL